MPARKLAEPVARRLPGDRFELRRGSWRGEYPMSEPRPWIEFYKRLRKRNERVYGPNVAALEKLLETDS